MLDPKLFRTDIDNTASQLARRGFVLDTAAIAALEDRRKQVQVQTQQYQNERNVKSKAIGQAKARGEDVKPLMDEVVHLSAALKQATGNIGKRGAGVNPLVTHGGWAHEIKRGAFSGRAALQPSDFEAEPTRGVRDNLSVNSRTTFPLDAQACSAQNRVGVTQFRLGLGLEDDNDFVADQEMVWSGGAAVADLPALVVYYTVP